MSHTNESRIKNLGLYGIKKRIKRTCIFCNQNYETKPSAKLKFCSISCLWKYNNLPENKKNRINKTSITLKELYKSGKLISSFLKLKGTKQTKEHIKKRLDSRKLNNPNWVKDVEKAKKNFSLATTNLFKNEKYRKTYSINKIKYYQEHPEKHPNRLIGRKHFVTKPQLFMFNQLKKIFGEYGIELNYSVKTNKTIRFIDVAMPRFRLGFEYDEPYWHKDIQKDIDRDNELKEVNWNIIHIRRPEQNAL